jgi:predicted dehydrogenase
MGRDLYDNVKAARAVFTAADEALGRPLSRLCFEGPEEELRQTINAQPALVTAAFACLEAVRELNKDALPAPAFVAGHSLGEYTALSVAGVFDFTRAVRLAREMIQAGDLGEIIHFRTRYADDTLSDPAAPHTWRQEKRRAGSGAVGDIASHALDLGRFLIGELKSLSGMSRIVVPRRPARAGSRQTKPVDVEDLYAGAIEFANGAMGTLEVSMFCPGRKNYLTFEVNGTRGSVGFNLERLNELEVFRVEAAGRRDRGFKTVLVTDGDHPYGGRWWPPGHIIGWEHAFVHQLHHLVRAIAGETTVPPLAADFRDGYLDAVLCDALVEAARTGRRVRV